MAVSGLGVARCQFTRNDANYVKWFKSLNLCKNCSYRSRVAPPHRRLCAHTTAFKSLASFAIELQTIARNTRLQLRIDTFIDQLNTIWIRDRMWLIGDYFTVITHIAPNLSGWEAAKSSLSLSVQSPLFLLLVKLVYTVNVVELFVRLIVKKFTSLKQ